MPSAQSVDPTSSPAISRRPKNCKVMPPVESQISTSTFGAPPEGAVLIAVTWPRTCARRRQVAFEIGKMFSL